MFLYLAHQAPHTPLQAPHEYQRHCDQFKTEKRRIFCAMVRAIDESTKQIVTVSLTRMICVSVCVCIWWVCPSACMCACVWLCNFQCVHHCLSNVCLCFSSTEVFKLKTQALKKSKLYENTLVVFTSDNGASRGEGGSNFPLRGAKQTIWEGGTRVPTFIHGPRRAVLV